jgi:diketogulonate reductase-like aldo/keto reductase
MVDIQKISKIGIGTWGVGGFMEPDNSIDIQRQTDAMAHMFSEGVNLVEINMLYSAGKSVEILGNAIKLSGVPRKDIFVCASIHTKQTKSLDVSKGEVDSIFNLLETDYIDTVQFNMSSFAVSGFEKITKWVDTLLASGKIRYTSITNEDLSLLKKYHEKYGDKLFSHEVGFNFEVRVHEELNIIKYANENDVRTVVFQPLRSNRTADLNWDPIVKLANKYGKTQNQVLLNWIVSKGYIPLTRSDNIDHINENIAALDFVIEDSDIELLDNFKISNYTQPEIAWDMDSPGVRVDQLSNVFDDHYNQL